MAAWVDVFGDRVSATAILNRLLHHTGSLSICGNSCRVKVKLRAGLVWADRAEACAGWKSFGFHSSNGGLGSR